MKVVSLVPSWTETLLEAGIDVIGRTRYCIHPQEQIHHIPVVGGTKDWKWEKILELNPDFLILDKEENPKFMAEQNQIPFLATHVSQIVDVSVELNSLAKNLSSEKLLDLATQWNQIAKKPLAPIDDYSLDFPGLIKWGQKPTTEIKRVIYIIWRNPWMAVSKNTFVGSMLNYCGFTKLDLYEEKYPTLNLEQYEKNSTLLLFSSEPYPFLKKQDELDKLNFPYAFVDGESFSWFGVRSLRFLQKHL